MICRANDENALEVDFEAIEPSVPHLTLSSSIGNGINFVSKFITSKLSRKLENAQILVDYLLSLTHQGEVSKIHEPNNLIKKTFTFHVPIQKLFSNSFFM